MVVFILIAQILNYRATKAKNVTFMLFLSISMLLSPIAYLCTLEKITSNWDNQPLLRAFRIYKNFAYRSTQTKVIQDLMNSGPDPGFLLLYIAKSKILIFFSPDHVLWTKLDQTCLSVNQVDQQMKNKSFPLHVQVRFHCTQQ